MHKEAYDWMRQTLAYLPDRKSVLEIGSKDVNGSIRPLFDKVTNYVGIDLVEGRSVDIVADAATFRIDAQFDTVVCMEVLEHTDKGREICRTAHHHLLPNGIFLVTAATGIRAPHSAIDGQELREGEYYQNVKYSDLSFWLSDFKRRRITKKQWGDIYAIAHKGEW